MVEPTRDSATKKIALNCAAGAAATAGGRVIESWRIEAGAMTLFERLRAWEDVAKPQACHGGCATAQALVDRWRKAVAGGNREFFCARLEWDNLDEERVIEALSWTLDNPEIAASRCPNCGWYDELQADFNLGISLLDDRATHLVQGWSEEFSIPFTEMWAPWVARATAQVSLHVAVGNGRILESALEGLSRHLLLQIGELGAESAFSQFNRRRSAELSALDDMSGNLVYQKWVHEQIDCGLAPLFEEFPVLARQLHRLLQTWQETTIELFDRIENDWLALATLLTGTKDLGPLIAVSPGLSDRHYGGRRVAILGFEGGKEIVYKPRSLVMEEAFAGFLRWLQTAGLEPAPQVPKVLLGDGYGWMEVVQTTELRDAAEVSRWFKSAGVLMCLAHILGGSDLHVDNVMSGRLSPVLIDLETLLHPEVAAGAVSEGGVQTAITRVFEQVRSSFLATGMLTFLQEGPNGQVIDIGGLCGTGGHNLGVDTVTWRHVGKDGLHQVKQQARARQWCNVPRIDGEPQMAASYAADIEAGFSTTYRMVMKHRPFLRSPQGVVKWFAGSQARVLLRPTEMYARVLQFAIRPAYQRDGMSAGVLIEALNRQLLKTKSQPPGWDLAAWERQMLEGLDIPHLTAVVDSMVLEASHGRVIEGMISASGLGLFEKRLAGLSEEDLEQQVRLMVLSLEPQGVGSNHVGSKHTMVAPSESNLLLANMQGQRLAQDGVLDVARSIADELLTRAVRGTDHSMIWLDPVHIRPEGRLDRGVSYYLYSGSAGIALFFAAMAQVLHDRTYREAAEGALLPILTVLSAAQAEKPFNNEGLGACNGLGGIVYSLTLAAVFLDQPEYLRLARRVVGFMTPDRIAADQVLDVEGGAAGAILGLLALQEVSPDDNVLETALACARHLVIHQRSGPGAGAAWPNRQGGMLTGFAHGASGIALALVRLSRWVNDASLLDAAGKALQFENSLYDPEKKNWPLLLTDQTTGRSESRYMSAWCHGAPGIALARSYMRDLLPQAEADDTLNGALTTTLSTSLDGPDHLCCGTLGKSDILFSVGEILGREALQRAAEAMVAMVLQRASTTGSFRLDQGRGPSKNGFFRGLAGIGYELVRLGRPDEVPSVLAFLSPQSYKCSSRGE